jgi:hypothetical protein
MTTPVAPRIDVSEDPASWDLGERRKRLLTPEETEAPFAERADA